MKLSVWSSYYVELSPEDALLELRKFGYEHCELSDEHALKLLERGDATEVGKEFGRFAKEIGMDLLQGHLLFWLSYSLFGRLLLSMVFSCLSLKVNLLIVCLSCYPNLKH